MPDRIEWVELKMKPFSERWVRFVEQIPGQFELLVERGNDQRDAAAAVLAGSSVILGPQISVALAGVDGQQTTSFRDRWLSVAETLRATYERAIELGRTPEESAEIALHAAGMLVQPDLSILVRRYT